jgi:ABC-type phosphate transport system substrate-binding protein
MTKRAIALVLAAAALTMLTASSLAMAEWKHHQTPIAQNKQIQITGSTKFSSGGRSRR